MLANASWLRRSRRGLALREPILSLQYEYEQINNHVEIATQEEFANDMLRRTQSQKNTEQK